jgi:hypothetical protein
LNIHPNQITQCRGQLREGAAGVFGEASPEAAVCPGGPQGSARQTRPVLSAETFFEEAFSKAGLLNVDDCHHQLKTSLPRIL